MVVLFLHGFRGRCILLHLVSLREQLRLSEEAIVALQEEQEAHLRTLESTHQKAREAMVTGTAGSLHCIMNVVSAWHFRVEEAFPVELLATLQSDFSPRLAEVVSVLD